MAIDTRTVTGADKLKLRIATVRASLQLPKLVDEIGVLLLRRVKDRFVKGIDADYQPWTPLSPNTIKEKARLGYGDKGMLRRTDAMFNAIHIIRGSNAGAIVMNSGAGVRIGINDPLILTRARTHQRGSRKVPARPFLGVGRLDIKAVDSLMRRKAAQLDKL